MTSEDNVDKIPKTAVDFIGQGWSFHASKKDDIAAEESFQRAISMDPKSIDAYYGLGLVLKAQDRKQESIDSFTKAIDLLKTEPIDEQARGEMMRRLSMAHINQMKSGDWGLEGEIWKHSK